LSIKLSLLSGREMFKFLVAYFFYSDTYSTVASVGLLVIQQVTLCP
jgi:MFS-type transporter involved in bile tolerance (Atg22 family)